MNHSENIEIIRKSFSRQAKDFENKNMNFSKKEYLDYTTKRMELNKNDIVLETAAGTCVCGRSIAPFVSSVTCLDATSAMLEVGKAEAKKEGIQNINFIEGLVENIPFKSESFNVVLSRLAFHHFPEIQKPFSEMSRVLKTNGKLIIIDMEAPEEKFRSVRDEIEILRDPSHVKNRSRQEFLDLYKQHGFQITCCETTELAVSLKAWLALTHTPKEHADLIIKKLTVELNGGEKTSLAPYKKDGSIYFLHRWLFLIGEKTGK